MKEAIKFDVRKMLEKTDNAGGKRAGWIVGKRARMRPGQYIQVVILVK